ncbi:hypothetical protein [Pseudoalteromonas maricaloris]
MLGLIFCIAISSWIYYVMRKAKALRGADVSLFSVVENNEPAEVLPMQNFMARRIRINAIEDDNERYKALMNWEQEVNRFTYSREVSTISIEQENVVDFRFKK